MLKEITPALRHNRYSNMKFLHTADLHLDSPLHGLERYPGAPVARIRTATRQALERLVDLAIAEEVSFVLIAGDIYDGDWKDYNTGLYFAAQMSRLRDSEIRVFLISGNHDAASQISKTLRLPENVHTFSHRRPESVEVDQLGVVVHGQSFAKREMLENISAHYPAAIEGLFNIGMLHTSATGRPGHENYAPCSVEELVSKGYHYWALGHVHAREILRENPWIVFPGNTQGRQIRESGVKGASLVTVEDFQVVSVEHRAADVLRWYLCEVDCAEARNGDDVMHLVRNEKARGSNPLTSTTLKP